MQEHTHADDQFDWSSTNGGMVSSVDLLDDDEGSEGDFASYSLLGEQFDIGSFSATSLDVRSQGGSDGGSTGDNVGSRKAFADGRRERIVIQVN